MFASSLLQVPTPQGGAPKRPRGPEVAASGNPSVDEKLKLLAESEVQIFARLRTLEAGAGRTYTMPKATPPSEDRSFGRHKLIDLRCVHA